MNVHELILLGMQGLVCVCEDGDGGGGGDDDDFVPYDKNIHPGLAIQGWVQNCLF